MTLRGGHYLSYTRDFDLIYPAARASLNDRVHKGWLTREDPREGAELEVYYFLLPLLLHPRGVAGHPIGQKGPAGKLVRSLTVVLIDFFFVPLTPIVVNWFMALSMT